MSTIQPTLFNVFDKQKLCKECGNVFEVLPGKNASFYCSADCRRRARSKREHPNRVRKCKGCGIEFTRPFSYAGANVAYCSKECRVTSTNKRRQIKAKTREGSCAVCKQRFAYIAGRGADGRKTCSAECRRSLCLTSRRKRHASAPKCETPNCQNRIGRPSFGLCEACYMRLRRNGTVETIAKKRRHSYRQESGYVLISNPEHPLSGSGGYVAEHRMVMYDLQGEGPHPCFWCGKSLTWKRINIDHLNEVKDDNRPENLVISCHRCNEARGSIVPFMKSMRPEARETFIRVMMPTENR
jgi:hypothetical protein